VIKRVIEGRREGWIERRLVEGIERGVFRGRGEGELERVPEGGIKEWTDGVRVYNLGRMSL
jgi:hypothetical protein